MGIIYNEWVKNLKPYRTLYVSRERVRDLYKLPNNVILIEDTIIPWNIFLNIRTMLLVDLSYKTTDLKILDILNKYKGIIETDMGYLDDGYFNPRFDEILGELSPMERAFNFVYELDKHKLIYGNLELK